MGWEPLFYIYSDGTNVNAKKASHNTQTSLSPRYTEFFLNPTNVFSFTIHLQAINSLKIQN